MYNELSEESMADFFEIVELSNGDIGLRKADDTSEDMIVRIKFSAEARESLKNNHIEVAHAMIEAGVSKVGELSGLQLEQEAIVTDPETPDIVH
ncbi:MAG TPA: hypothetical protein DIC30_10630 [Oceanospirillales bacterium]|jgi:hypothetical protein|nr:hypothetical protein [Oleispira sp.]HCM06453.1 hypothetical protein [Oceanospirillales bacterium]|tara:strand:- start:3923 stop:4204 length:282 start_codon:yes stop_codon:yes gene_type:complete